MKEFILFRSSHATYFSVDLISLSFISKETFLFKTAFTLSLSFSCECAFFLKMARLIWMFSIKILCHFQAACSPWLLGLNVCWNSGCSIIQLTEEDRCTLWKKVENDKWHCKADDICSTACVIWRTRANKYKWAILRALLIDFLCCCHQNPQVLQRVQSWCFNHHTSFLHPPCLSSINSKCIFRILVRFPLCHFQ